MKQTPSMPVLMHCFCLWNNVLNGKRASVLTRLVLGLAKTQNNIGAALRGFSLSNPDSVEKVQIINRFSEVDLLAAVNGKIRRMCENL